MSEDRQDREQLLEFFQTLQNNSTAWNEFRRRPRHYVENSNLSVKLQFLVRTGEVEAVLKILNERDDVLNSLLIIW